MRILLLGDFSSVHNNLKKGLINLGHSVSIASSGDGWKKISFDIELPTLKSTSQISKILYRLKLLRILLGFKNFDVIQLVNPGIIPTSFFPSQWIIKRLRKKNNKIFLLAAGSDYYYWTVSRKLLRYGPFEDNIKYDIQNKEVRFLRKDFKRFNKFLAEFVDGIIPIMYEYELAYKDFPNVTQVIPIPLDLDNMKIYSKKKDKSKKILIFHGLSRYGFKGTRHIEKAFKVLALKYSEVANFLIKGEMPLNEYLELMQMTDIVIDQTSSYSLGVNGVFALGMGKIVLGGAEPESLNAFGIKRTPVINIKPDPKDIVNKISEIIDRNNLSELRQESRKFAKELHCSEKVASKYIDTWNRA